MRTAGRARLFPGSGEHNHPPGGRNAACYKAFRPRAMRRLLFADDRGTVYDHPGLLAAARSGDEIVRPQERPAPLPAGARLVWLPGRRPVGVDPASGEPVVLREVKVGRRTVVPHAVGAVLPPGWTRTLLPAARRSPLAAAQGPVLPQWAYTAAAQGDRGPVAWA